MASVPEERRTKSACQPANATASNATIAVMIELRSWINSIHMSRFAGLTSAVRARLMRRIIALRQTPAQRRRFPSKP